MAEAVYILCAATSMACAGLLFRAFLNHRTRLLLWSCLCFVCFALNNMLLFVDLIIVPDTADLSLIRSVTAVAGVSVLLHGLIWESR